MARSSRWGWWACTVLFAGVVWGAVGIAAQDPERGSDESVPSRAGRRGRGGFGENPGRPAFEPNRPGAAETSRLATGRDQGFVDTSNHEKRIYVVKSVPAQGIASALERHFRGDSGMSLVAETASNSLLISAPPNKMRELLTTIQELDLAPSSTTIEVTMLDCPDLDAGQDVNVRELMGPSDRVRAKISEFKKAGRVQRVRRFRVLALNNQFTSLQVNGDKATPAGPFAAFQGGNPAAGRQGNAPRFPVLGTVIQCTARISGEPAVVMELMVHDAPPNPDGQPATPGVATQFQGTLSVARGTTVVASEIATEAESGPLRIVVLVSVDVDGTVLEKPQDAKPAAGGR